MGKINPKQHVEGYKDQKAFERAIPISGTYDVVTIKMGRQKVGAKGTEKLRLIEHVLKVVEVAKPEEKDEALKLVGNTFARDIWRNWYKEDGTLNFNGQQLVNTAIACGNESEFDPDDDKQLVKILTGVPHRIKIDVEAREGEKRTYYDVNVVEVKHLPKDARKKYTEAADFSKIMPKMEERLMEPADYSTGSKDGKGKGRRLDERKEQEEDAFNRDDGGDDLADDDDLPFS